MSRFVGWSMPLSFESWEYMKSPGVCQEFCRFSGQGKCFQRFADPNRPAGTLPGPPRRKGRPRLPRIAAKRWP